MSGNMSSSAAKKAACSRALNFGTPTYRTIKQILKEGLDQQPTLFTATELDDEKLDTWNLKSFHDHICF